MFTITISDDFVLSKVNFYITGILFRQYFTVVSFLGLLLSAEQNISIFLLWLSVIAHLPSTRECEWPFVMC